MCLRVTQTHKNNKIFVFIRMVGLHFELLGNQRFKIGKELIMVVAFFLYFMQKPYNNKFSRFFKRFFQISNHCAVLRNLISDCCFCQMFEQDIHSLTVSWNSFTCNRCNTSHFSDRMMTKRFALHIIGDMNFNCRNRH